MKNRKSIRQLYSDMKSHWSTIRACNRALRHGESYSEIDRLHAEIRQAKTFIREIEREISARKAEYAKRKAK